jgi:hypothetical protein
MHPNNAALALMGLFQKGRADSSVADSVADELEFLTLGNNYVDEMDGITDVVDGILDAADGKANLGERCVLLQILFDDDSNINSLTPMAAYTSEVQQEMIIMGHRILSCHVLVVWSFFIL